MRLLLKLQQTSLVFPDSDDEEEANQTKTNTETAHTNGQTDKRNNTEKVNEQKDKQTEFAADNPNEEEEIYEWEYYYEDAELKKDEVKTEENKTTTATVTPKKLATAPTPQITTAAKAVTATAAEKVTQNIAAVKPTKTTATPNKAPTVPTPLIPTAATTTKTTTAAIVNGWECPSCTLMNEPTRPGCAACATDRPTIPDGATAKIAEDGQHKDGEQKPAAQVNQCHLFL